MPNPELEQLAVLLYRKMGYVAPWGRHPDRVLKFRQIAEAVIEDGWRRQVPVENVAAASAGKV